MGDEKDQGFVIRDRRGRGEEAPAAASAPTPPTPEAAPAESHQADAHGHAGHLPVNFSSFVISMGSSALMLMGEQLDP
ncbi:MAG TPA: hypothetical protein PKW52_17395, partial [Nitrospira sp.]|nr:hypothetical protein [Nitrospira sp.]